MDKVDTVNKKDKEEIEYEYKLNLKIDFKSLFTIFLFVTFIRSFYYF